MANKNWLTVIINTISNFLLRLAVFILSYADIPKRIAIIMDGNRRFSSKIKAEKIVGHESGLEKLKDVLIWCSNLGVKEVTAWAFSLDNFNRDKKEIDDLMKLIREKFSILSNNEEYFQEYGVKVNIIGNVSFFEEEIQKIFYNCVEKTKYNKKYL